MKKLIIFTVFINFITTQIIDNQFGRAIKCKRDDGVNQRCMPVFENIAFGKQNRDIYANNTCGLKGKSEYCVQTGTSGAKKICEICDNKNQGHPAHLMTDKKEIAFPTWWQSETLLENRYGVHIILDIKKKYNVAWIRLIFHTIRPHSFSIMKRTTYHPHEPWLPYQHYSRTCEKTYGVPINKRVKLDNQKIALCTDVASRMIPLSGGNVAYSTLYNRPGKNDFDNYPDLQDWVTVTALRFNLDRLNTFGDEVFGDPKVLKSYYFAISDIAVGGRCKCNGHASTCAESNEGKFYCECDHNTAGVDCEKCLSLYNNRPWKRALGRSAYPCEACNCNGHADECVFDEVLWVDNGNSNGGRCINCEKNTAGINCEKCKDYHYREFNHGACTPCGCNQIGSRSQRCNNKGVCSCQRGIIGEKCDRCREGYYGFSSMGCRKCYCDTEGSLHGNCDATGQCKCKENTVGRKCDKCRANHFDLDKQNPKGCKACFCYGHGISCSSLGGYERKEILSSFDADSEGWTVQDQYGTDYTKDNLEWNDHSQNIRFKPVANKHLYFIAPRQYLGNRLSSYSKRFSFLYGVFLENNDPPIQSGRSDIILEGADLTANYEITAQGNVKPEGRFINFEYRLVEPVDMSTFDFQRLLSDLTAIKIRITYSDTRRGAIDDIKMVSTQFVSLNSPQQVSWQEKCECERGYTGDQCEKCDSGYTRSVGTSGAYGRCTPCECHNHGNQCNPETGVCDCKDNTTGRNCELCKTGFYGNPTRGNSDDCKPCPCIFANQCILIGARIKCTDCPVGHVGDYCEVCSDGYYGDPKGELKNPTRCQKCDCSGNVDPNAIGNCNGLTGGCLKCIYNTKNGQKNMCEECAGGFYGDALAESKGNCSACNCFENGTLTKPGYISGDPISCDQNGKCPCRENVIGNRCDMCPAGHWNVASGKGCQKCGCDPDGSVGEDCDIKSGKCKCKPGVSGRTCNECAAGHYKFSSTGCSACNCHPDGSKHQNCANSGVCECLPGVLGIKCDRCPENKYNLSVGCIACPKCFDLIQVAVNKLREKVSTFNFTKGNYTNKDPQIDIRDENFEAAINALEKEIQALRKKMDELLKGDQELFDFLKSLTQQFDRFVARFEVLKEMVKKSKGASENGQIEIIKAEDFIELIKALLKDAERKLQEEGALIYAKAVSSADDLSATGKRMREIAEEARKLAKRHEEEAADIKQTTDMAYNTSSAALKTGQAATEKEEITNKNLKDMTLEAGEAGMLAKDSRMLIKQAENISSSALTDSKDLIEEGKKPLPDFKINQTKAGAILVTNDAKAVDKQSKKLNVDNQDEIEQLSTDDKEGRDLIAEGQKLRNNANNMYDVANNASIQAKSAQEDGLKVAKEAQDMLNTLLGFNEIIARSKRNATKALKSIDLIKQLIKEANETAVKASFNADVAFSDSIASLTTVENAAATTDQAKEQIRDLMEKARVLLNETMSFMMNEMVQTKEDVVNTNASLEKYKQQAQNDSIKVKDALDASVAAGNAAAKAGNDLSQSLVAVEELMAEIDALDQIDFVTLKDAEERFAKAKDVIERKIAIEIDLLNTKLVEQQGTIKKYELDLGPLKLEIAAADQLYKTIPEECFRTGSKFDDKVKP